MENRLDGRPLEREKREERGERREGRERRERERKREEKKESGVWLFVTSSFNTCRGRSGMCCCPQVARENPNGAETAADPRSPPRRRLKRQRGEGIAFPGS